MLGGKGSEGEDVTAGIDEHGGGVGESAVELFNDAGVLGPHLLGVGLLEDGAHEGGHHRLRALGHPGEQAPHEVRPTSLPSCTRQHGGNRLAQPLVAVGDDELHAGEAAGNQAAQEGQPPGTIFAGHEVKPEHLPLPLCSRRWRPPPRRSRSARPRAPSW